MAFLTNYKANGKRYFYVEKYVGKNHIPANKVNVFIRLETKESH